MNKRESVLEKAFVLACRELAKTREEDTNYYMATLWSKAEEELKDSGFLTANQKTQLKEKISRMQQATGHTYETISHCWGDNYTVTRLAYRNYNGDYDYDSISGGFLSFLKETFVDYKIYKIKDLLDD